MLVPIVIIWLFAASLTDLKKREVADWLSFSLIAIAIAVRASESIIQWSYVPILTSVAGVAVFFILSNALYYGKLFAGGDVKLMTSLGAVLPSFSFLSNILVAGSVYGIFYSIALAAIHRKRFCAKLKSYKSHILISALISLAFLAGYMLSSDFILLMIAAFAFLFPSLFIFVNAVEKSSLIQKVGPEKLTEGDWLLRDVKVRGKVIKAGFDGLSKSDIAFLKKSKKRVYVKYGIPFIPVFLIAFVLTAWIGNVLMIFI